MKRNRYIGDRQFYAKVLAIAIPVMIQNGITNFVNMLDNIMVGMLGTEAMSGVSIVNQFLFVFNLLVFGAVSAAGIFTAQYFGSGDTDGVRYTFRFKLYTCLATGVLGILTFALFGPQLVGLFLHESDGAGDLALTLSFGMEYLGVMLIGLLPYAISQVYASTMRETGHTVPPMVASVVAVFTNLVLNLILIFGLLGAPALGVRGAAIATVISRFLELIVLVIYAHTHREQCPYIVGVYRSLRVPRALVGRILIKGLPLMLNEAGWSLAVTMRNQCYSVRGLDVVAALNIATTLQNLLSVVYISLGSAIAIILGRELGAGEMESAKESSRKLIAFTVFAAVLVSALFAGGAFLFPKIYNTSDAVRELATYLMLIGAAVLPFDAYAFSAYYTMRSGGQVFVTILFDSVFMWCLVIPLCVLIAYFTSMNIYWLFLITQATCVIKAGLGVLLLKRGTWVRRLV